LLHSVHRSGKKRCLFFHRPSKSCKYIHIPFGWPDPCDGLQLPLQRLFPGRYGDPYKLASIFLIYSHQPNLNKISEKKCRSHPHKSANIPKITVSKLFLTNSRSPEEYPKSVSPTTLTTLLPVMASIFDNYFDPHPGTFDSIFRRVGIAFSRWINFLFDHCFPSNSTDVDQFQRICSIHLTERCIAEG